MFQYWKWLWEFYKKITEFRKYYLNLKFEIWNFISKFFLLEFIF
jgi:hypothetical protein